MSAQNTFLPLIPAAHRVAIIYPFTSPVDAATGDDAVIEAIQKTRRSSSTATAESNSAAEEPALPADTVEEVVESPTDDVKATQTEPAVVHSFLKLGN